MLLPFAIRDVPGDLDVVAIGENSLDFVALTVGALGQVASKQTLNGFRVQPGGQMATAALACARLGVRTSYIGAFGTDEWGSRARQPLDAAGVHVVDVVRTATAGRVAVILVDAAGDRVVFEHREPALLVVPDDVDAATIAAARVLLVDATHPAAAIHAARLARAAGTISVVDVDRRSPDVDTLLSEVDVVIVPEPFVQARTGTAHLKEGLSHMAARCPHSSLVIATCGAAGSLALCAGQFLRMPAFRVDVVDTTGAGDAFRAGFAVAILTLGRGATLEEILQFATVVAGLNCRSVGAQSGLPSMGEVRAALASAVK